MKMMNLDDRQQVNEFIVEQMNSDYELTITNINGKRYKIRIKKI